MDGDEHLDRPADDRPDRADRDADADRDRDADDRDVAATPDGDATEREHDSTDGQPDAVADDETPPTADDETPPAADDDTSPSSDGEGSMPGVPDPGPEANDVPEDVRKYARFTKMDGAQYDRVNEFLRDRTYITAREWAIARLCSDFRTETGVEMTKIGENLPELVPFMTDTYTPQAVNQARSSFEEKVRKAGATFLYGAMCDFFTAEELDDVMYESTEIAKFLLEVEGVDLSVEEELEAEERISSVMREVREASEELREQEAE
ncbi:DUF5806 family protein [Halosolutus halophilus]|uniref:DUF5806 family protein n=1 Tax=Halosolutus halophilus TaxID=1552990 RepID=UPI0022350805|nr:DUF5806 family protein [Halosolutus halophilus]